MSNKQASCPQNQQLSQPDPKKQKRIRTSFTSNQLFQLENEFKSDPYLNRIRRFQIAQELSLDEKQIKIWFQNRRMKYKKDSIKEVRGRRSFENKAEKSRMEDIGQSAITYSQDFNFQNTEQHIYKAAVPTEFTTDPVDLLQEDENDHLNSMNPLEMPENQSENSPLNIQNYFATFCSDYLDMSYQSSSLEHAIGTDPVDLLQEDENDHLNAMNPLEMPENQWENAPLSNQNYFPSNCSNYLDMGYQSTSLEHAWPGSLTEMTYNNNAPVYTNLETAPPQSHNIECIPSNFCALPPPSTNWSLDSVASAIHRSIQY